MIQLRSVVALLCIAIVFAAFWPADPAPYAWGTQPKDNAGPNTVGEMRSSASFVDRQLGPNESVFSTMGEYYSLAAHTSPYSPRIYHTVSPQHGQIEGLNRTSYHDQARAAFIADLRGGTLGLLIMTKRTAYMLKRWPVAHSAFRANYCRIEPTPAVYQKNGVHVYEYAPERDECTNRTQFETVE